MLKSSFDEFDNSIRLSATSKTLCQKEHTELREKLAEDEGVKKFRIADFLQGSYARSTGVRSGEPDVDIVLVTNISKDQFLPEFALGVFLPFCIRHYGQENVKMNGRSICIDRGSLSLDLVPTSAPSEAVLHNIALYEEFMEPRRQIIAKSMHERHEGDAPLDYDEDYGSSGSTVAEGDWAKDPLLIPDRHASKWQETHPIATKQFSVEKNARCNHLFLRVVRAIKWWKKHGSGHDAHPKSYPIEHMVGDLCPDNFKSVAEGVASTLEAMFIKYEPFAVGKRVPILVPRGLEESEDKPNVLALVTAEDFSTFVDALGRANALAGAAMNATDVEESKRLWGQLFGNAFPTPGGSGSSRKVGFPERTRKGDGALPGHFA